MSGPDHGEAGACGGSCVDRQGWESAPCAGEIANQNFPGDWVRKPCRGYALNKCTRRTNPLSYVNCGAALDSYLKIRNLTP